jgi:hypothetical protein
MHMSDEFTSEQVGADLVKLKADIIAANNLPLNQHSNEFEKIYIQLQQALTNLDGV